MKNMENRNGISTFQGSDASIEGVIEFEGTIRMDGIFKGKISSPGGVVIVGEKAVIDAEIQVGVAVIMGKVNGMINAKEKIELFPPAKVSGDLRAPLVAMESGVCFQGNCIMGKRNPIKENAR